MSATRRYYVIGESVQVMKKPWLSSFPTDPKAVKDSDIFNSLKATEVGNRFTVFTDLETAKTCSRIKVSNDNMTVSSVSLYYRPIIEVSLLNEDHDHLQQINLDITDGSGLVLNTTALTTEPNNIKQAYSYYYRAGGREVSVTLEYTDLQKIFRDEVTSSKCSIQ